MKIKKAHSIPLFFSMLGGFVYLLGIWVDFSQMYDTISNIPDESASALLSSVYSLGSYIAIIFLLPQLVSVFLAFAFAAVGFFDGLASCGFVSGTSFLFGVLFSSSNSNSIGALLLLSLFSFAGAMDTIFSNSRKIKAASAELSLRISSSVSSALESSGSGNEDSEDSVLS